MFAVMKELVRQKYPRLIFPEHPRGLDADRERPTSSRPIRAAARIPASCTTWVTPGPCCRQPWHREKNMTRQKQVAQDFWKAKLWPARPGASVHVSSYWSTYSGSYFILTVHEVKAMFSFKAISKFVIVNLMLACGCWAIAGPALGPSRPIRAGTTAGGSVVLETSALSFHVHPESGAFEIQDKSGGVVWQSNPRGRASAR